MGGESSECFEGRRDKRIVRGDKSNVNVNGESKLAWLDNNAVLNAILKAVLSLLSRVSRAKEDS